MKTPFAFLKVAYNFVLTSFLIAQSQNAYNMLWSMLRFPLGKRSPLLSSLLMKKEMHNHFNRQANGGEGIRRCVSEKRQGSKFSSASIVSTIFHLLLHIPCKKKASAQSLFKVVINYSFGVQVHFKIMSKGSTLFCLNSKSLCVSYNLASFPNVLLKITIASYPWHFRPGVAQDQPL